MQPFLFFSAAGATHQKIKKAAHSLTQKDAPKI